LILDHFIGLRYVLRFRGELFAPISVGSHHYGSDV
jgi:hypothetical protein